MKVAVTGAGGLIGSALARHLEDRGDHVIRLVRRSPASPGEVSWDPEEERVDAGALEGIDHLVHLAGENIGARRWTHGRKRSIRASRVRGTEAIARSIAGLRAKPSTMVGASALGYYGDRGEEVLSEQSRSGRGFRAEVCAAWENATTPAQTAGIRVVLLRTGIVLSRNGGLLPYLLRPARLGLAPRLGSGLHYWSWITRDDAVAAIVHLLDKAEVRGPVNMCAPEPVRQGDFARALAAALGGKRTVPIPAWALEIALGRERAREVLLSSNRAVPERLLASGYRFRHAEIGHALSSLVTEPGG